MFNDDLPQIQAFMKAFHIKSDEKPLPSRFLNYGTLIILSMGGPALCAKILYGLSCSSPHGRPSPTVVFHDNLAMVNPQDIASYYDLSNTGIVIISKSGETLETLVETYNFLKIYDHEGLDIRDHFLVLTECDPKKAHPSSLRTLATAYDLPVLTLDHTIDGRFSLFSILGDILCRLFGVDFQTFKEGALEAKNNRDEGDRQTRDLYETLSSHNEIILWTYDEGLLPLVQWWAQLIGESLGRNGDGYTPVVALGPKDQHSQLQLYLGGPRNKFFTFLSKASHEKPIKPQPSFASFAHMDRDTLVGIQLHCVLETFRDHHIPHRLFCVDHHDAYAMGRLCMMIMIEVWCLGRLKGIDPFGQPDIEGLKQKVWTAVRKTIQPSP